MGGLNKSPVEGQGENALNRTGGFFLPAIVTDFSPSLLRDFSPVPGGFSAYSTSLVIYNRFSLHDKYSLSPKKTYLLLEVGKT